MAFVRVAALDDLWKGEMQGFVVGRSKILLVRTEHEVCAFADRCAHLGVPLSKGTLEGEVITCFAHHWQYDACTGNGMNPSGAKLTPFPVKIEAGEIYVDLEESTS